MQRFDLETHHSSVHDKRKDYKCDQCSKRFSQRSNLQTHVRAAHGELVCKCDGICACGEVKGGDANE